MARTVSFDRFTLDIDQRRLLADGAEIRLAPKAFTLLAWLIEERPKALSKEEIFERVWPGTFVSENNLATLISDLRTALGDDPREPRFIRTVYGYGYAFGFEVPGEPSREGGNPAFSGWRLIHEHREIALKPGKNLLGRGGDDVIVVDSPTVSRHHASVSVTGDRALVEDLGSKNGTWVGEVAVHGPAPLSDGDELRLGSVVLVVRFSAVAPTTETVAGS